MLNNRPKQLFDIPHYDRLPQGTLGVRVDTLPSYLNFDLQFELLGLRPTTEAESYLSPGGLEVTPNQATVDYYLERKTLFQMISVVINCALFEPAEDCHIGIPYSICLFPATHYGTIDQQDVRTVAMFDLEDLPNRDNVYANFDPFAGTWDFCAPLGFFGGHLDKQIFTDSIGFVFSTFFLATDVSVDGIVMPSPFNNEPELFRKFNKFRAKKYFTPFTDTKPRPIWGCESPIELYLFQTLLHRGLRPLPQVIIHRDGSIYPSYHDMYEESVLPPHGCELASTPDFYFPDQRVAIYCDSTTHHRRRKAKAKDAEVSERVETLGIKSVRISGKTIAHDLDKAVSEVLAHL